MTLDVSATTKAVDWTGVTNSPTVAGTSKDWSAFGDITWAATVSLSGNWRFNLYTAISINITSNGATMPPLQVVGTASVTLQDAYSTASYFKTWNDSTINTNGQTVTCASFGMGNNGAVVLTLGASTINCTECIVYANATVNANTSTIKVTGTGAFTGAGKTYNNVELNGSAHTVSGANTFAKLTVAASATITWTHTTTYTMADTAIGANVTFVSSSPGTGYTLAYSGATAPSTPTGAGLAIGADTTVTMASAPANKLYWVQDTGNWSDDNNHWSKLSGGLPAGLTNWVPTSSDSVYFDANSFSAAAKTVTVDASATMLSMDWTGATNTPTLAGASPNNINIHGDLTFIADMAVTYNYRMIFQGAGAGNTITNNGLAVSAGYVFSGGNGSVWTMQDAISTSGSAFGVTLSWGTLVTQGFPINAQAFTFSSGANLKTLTPGASVITVSLDVSVDGTNITITANTATWSIGRHFNGGGLSWNDVTLTGAVSNVSGSNTIRSFTLPAATTQTITFTDGTTQTAQTFVITGSAGKVKTLVGTGTAGWNIVKSGGGFVDADYLALSYSKASPGNTFYAGTHSTDTVGNTGWLFVARPAAVHSVLGEPMARAQDFVTMRIVTAPSKDDLEDTRDLWKVRVVNNT